MTKITQSNILILYLRVLSSFHNVKKFVGLPCKHSHEHLTAGIGDAHGLYKGMGINSFSN